VSRRWSEDRMLGSTELVETLLRGCVVSPPSLMVRRSIALRAGRFRTDLTWGHDWEWTLRLAELGSAAYASTPLAAYRVHQASGTHEILQAGVNGPQERRILEDTLARLESRDGAWRRLRRPALLALGLRHLYFAEQALLGGRRAVVLQNLWGAALARNGLVVRPTFWALLLSALGPLALYTRFRRLRGPSAGGPREE